MCSSPVHLLLIHCVPGPSGSSQACLFPCLLCFGAVKWVTSCAYLHPPYAPFHQLVTLAGLFTELSGPGLLLCGLGIDIPCVLCFSATTWWPGHACAHTFPVPGLQIGEVFACLFVISVSALPVVGWEHLFIHLHCLSTTTRHHGHVCAYACHVFVLPLGIWACLFPYLSCPSSTSCSPCWPGHACSHVCLVLAPP